MARAVNPEIVKSQPIEIIKNYNLLPVLRDGNCLISSVILGYLGETENNVKSFLERSKELFPNMNEEMPDKLFQNFGSLKNPNNIELLKPFILDFRKRLSNYIRKNLNTKFSNDMIFLEIIPVVLMERKDNCELELGQLLVLEGDHEQRINDLLEEQAFLENLMSKSLEEQAEFYLNELEQDGTWCGNLEIAAICNLLQCKILVKDITTTGENRETKIIDIPSVPIDPNIKSKAEVKLCRKENHYSYFQIDAIWQREQINSLRNELKEVYESKKNDPTFTMSPEEIFNIEEIQQDRLTKLIQTNTSMVLNTEEFNNGNANENQESVNSEQKSLLEEFYDADEQLAWQLQNEELEEAYACSQ